MLRRLPFAAVWFLVVTGLWSGLQAVLEFSWLATDIAYELLLPLDTEFSNTHALLPIACFRPEPPLDRGLNIVYQLGLHTLAYVGVLYFAFALITLAVVRLPRRQRFAPLLSLCASVATVWTCQWASAWLLQTQLELPR